MRTRKLRLTALLAGGILGLFSAGLPTDAFGPSQPSDPPASKLVRLRIIPAHIRLHGQSDLERVIVVGDYSDGSTSDLTELARKSIADAATATFLTSSRTRLLAKKQGRTNLVVRHQGLQARAIVEVAHAKPVGSPSFTNDVVPVLTRAGCNAGSCHGAAQGKNGFHLSLFGYDIGKDHTRLTRELRGRRVNPTDPDNSLLLLKPTQQVPHKGGLRLPKGSKGYATIRDWIADGARSDVTKAPALTRIEVLPRQAVLTRTGQRQRFLVRAHYDDGSDRDVTPLAILSSSNTGAGKIAADGMLTAGRPGETHVLARFGTKAEVAQVLVVPDRHPQWPARIKPRNYVDVAVFDKLRKMRLTPAPLCDDRTYLRRVHLDILGELPTPSEIVAFVKDARPGKRQRVVRELVTRPAFADVWAMQWAEVLRVQRFRLERKGMHTYSRFLREALASGKPFDELVRELLTATGSAFRRPAANFFLVERNPRQVAESVAQNFLGIRLQCAQCHNHPFEQWTMDDYYGFAAFFARVGYKRGAHPYEWVVYPRLGGEIRNRRTQQTSAPRFLAGETPKFERTEDRRVQLAKWLTGPNNPWFAKNVANRVFARMFGKGLVDPVDDVRVSNPATHPGLHRELGRKLAAYRFDLRRLIQDIAASHTYQQATIKEAYDPASRRGYPVRRLAAEQLLTAIDQVTGVSTRFNEAPATAKAVAVPGGNSGNRFLDVFGRPRRASSCTCDRRNEPTLSQALHLLNGRTIREKLRRGNGRLRRLLAAKTPNEKILDELYARAYGRAPSSPERQRILALFPAPTKNKAKDSKQRTAIWEDVWWAVLNSKEFLFAH